MATSNLISEMKRHTLPMALVAKHCDLEVASLFLSGQVNRRNERWFCVYHIQVSMVMHTKFTSSVMVLRAVSYHSTSNCGPSGSIPLPKLKCWIDGETYMFQQDLASSYMTQEWPAKTFLNPPHHHHHHIRTHNMWLSSSTDLKPLSGVSSRMKPSSCSTIPKIL